jgi:hypothetical protein
VVERAQLRGHRRAARLLEGDRQTWLSGWPYVSAHRPDRDQDRRGCWRVLARVQFQRAPYYGDATVFGKAGSSEEFWLIALGRRRSSL